MRLDTIKIKIQSAENKELSWVEISSAAFFYNLKIVKILAKDKWIGLVVKANAYGHGMIEIAKLAEKSLEIDYLCTSSLSEALLLRQSKIKKPVLVLSIIDAEIKLAIKQNIDLVVFNLDLAQEINQIAKHLKITATVQIKIDTGLSRLGFNWQEHEKVKRIFKMEHLKVKGIFTHFAESDTDPEFTKMQQIRFEEILQKIKPFKPELIHSQNSSGTACYDFKECNFVRVGGLAYGLAKNQKIATQIYKKTELKLQVVLSLNSKIIEIKKIKAGEFIGYRKTAKAATDLTLAILPIGYVDGISKELANQGTVLINNKQAKIIGAISMNLMAVDVTKIACKVGDLAKIIGQQKSINPAEISQICKANIYEILTKLSLKLNRHIN